MGTLTAALPGITRLTAASEEEDCCLPYNLHQTRSHSMELSLRIISLQSSSPVSWRFGGAVRMFPQLPGNFINAPWKC